MIVKSSNYKILCFMIRGKITEVEEHYYELSRRRIRKFGRKLKHYINIAAERIVKIKERGITCSRESIKNGRSPVSFLLDKYLGSSLIMAELCACHCYHCPLWARKDYFLP